jgi:hypothetical protein
MGFQLERSCKWPEKDNFMGNAALYLHVSYSYTMKTCHVSYSCTFSYCHFMSLSPLFVAILWAYHHFQINPYQDNPSFDLPQPSSWVFPTMPVLFAPRSAAQLWRVALMGGLRPRVTGNLSLAKYSKRQKIETCFAMISVGCVFSISLGGYYIWFNHGRTSTINTRRPTVMSKKVD